MTPCTTLSGWCLQDQRQAGGASDLEASGILGPGGGHASDGAPPDVFSPLQMAHRRATVLPLIFHIPGPTLCCNLVAVADAPCARPHVHAFADAALPRAPLVLGGVYREGGHFGEGCLVSISGVRVEDARAIVVSELLTFSV